MASAKRPLIPSVLLAPHPHLHHHRLGSLRLLPANTITLAPAAHHTSLQRLHTTSPPHSPRVLQFGPIRPIPPALPRTLIPRTSRAYTTPSDPDPASPQPYNFSQLQSLTTSPHPGRIIIDVREPAELQATGRIPGAYNMPLTSNPDAFYLSPEDFFDRFGFEKPRPRSVPAVEKAEAGAAEGDEKEGEGRDDGGGVEEVIFYCKAGVRSRAAARMAREWGGVKVGDFSGGWMDWEGRGGASERR